MNIAKVQVLCLATLGLLTCTFAQTAGLPKQSPIVLHEDFRPWWLLDDARWIITSGEKAAFFKLDNDEARRNFSDQFWARRNPNPDTYENEFKNEHYRRLTYANKYFGDKVPGRLTARGRIYVEFGKPDNIQAETSKPSRETWHYKYVENLGQDIDFQFEQREGEWTVVKDPSGGKNFFELMVTTVPGPYDPCAAYYAFVGRACAYPVKQSPPPRFKDLEAFLSKHSEVTQIPVACRTNAVKVTNATDMVTVAVSVPNSNLTWREQNGKFEMSLRVMVRFTNLTGRVASIIEDEVYDSVSSAEFPERFVATRDYPKLIPLAPGRYRVDVAVKDVNANKFGLWSQGIVVPEFPTEEFLEKLKHP